MPDYKFKSILVDVDPTSHNYGQWEHRVPDPADGDALVWRQEYRVTYNIGTGNGQASRITNNENLKQQLPLGVGLGSVPPSDTLFFSTPTLAKPVLRGTLSITGTAVDGTAMTVTDTPISIEENRGNLIGDVNPGPKGMLKQDGVSLFNQNTINYNLAFFFFQFKKPLDTSSQITVSYLTSGLVFEECCHPRVVVRDGEGTRTTETTTPEGEREIVVDVVLDDIVGTTEGILRRDANGDYGTTRALEIDTTVTTPVITVDASRRTAIAGDLTIGADVNGNNGSINLNGVTISDFDTEVTRVLGASSIVVAASGNVELTNAIRIRDTSDTTAGNVRFNTQESRVEAYTGNAWIEVARDEHQGRTSNTRTPGQAIPVTTVNSSNSPYNIDQNDGLIICDSASSIQLNLPDPAEFT